MNRTSGRGIAFSLLLVQLFGGGAVGLAHTREPVDAPRRIESAQHEHCPVLHDAAVCVLCTFSYTRAVAPAPSGVALALPAVTASQAPTVAGPSAVSAPRTGDARAPPHSQG